MHENVAQIAAAGRATADNIFFITPGARRRVNSADMPQKRIASSAKMLVRENDILWHETKTSFTEFCDAKRQAAPKSAVTCREDASAAFISSMQVRCGKIRSERFDLLAPSRCACRAAIALMFCAARPFERRARRHAYRADDPCRVTTIFVYLRRRPSARTDIIIHHSVCSRSRQHDIRYLMIPRTIE